MTQYICFNSLDGFHSIDTLIEEGKELLKTGLTNFTDVIIDNNELSILLFYFWNYVQIKSSNAITKEHSF